jgi:hypothetical protein
MVNRIHRHHLYYRPGRTQPADDANRLQFLEGIDLLLLLVDASTALIAIMH